MAIRIIQNERLKANMEETLKALTLLLAAWVEAAASVVIGLAALEAASKALLLFLPLPRPPRVDDPKEVLRLKLGRWLAVALELELGADILRTAVSPTWTEIGQLAAIAVLRTALNFFLQREIDEAEARETGRRTSALAEAVDASTSRHINRS